MKSTLTDPVRKCAVCGTFYPGDARELAESIDSLVRDVPPRDKGTVRGIVAPMPAIPTRAPRPQPPMAPCGEVHSRRW